jgi:hypothetical protein
MNGLLRRLKRRRAATADENPPGTPAASEPVDATATYVTVEGGSGLSEQEEEHLRRQRDVPAGLDPADLEAVQREGSRRGRVRRRVRYLRRARELLLRDLGGFAYEVHRTAGGREHPGHREILERKAGRLAAVDAELRQLEARLGEAHPVETVVREAGIGGACPNCGELHGSDAGWCAHCGTALSERARKRHEQEVDRTIAAREAAATEQAREAERAREAASAAAADVATGSAPAADAPTGELPGEGREGATADRRSDSAADRRSDSAADRRPDSAADRRPDSAAADRSASTAAADRSGSAAERRSESAVTGGDDASGDDPVPTPAERRS